MKKRFIFYLFLLFTIIPLLELALLIKVGSIIGFWRTIAIILITGAGGAYLARQQGFWVIVAIKQDFSEGRFPADKLLDGALILVGATLLITPGLFTDAFGILCLFPATRTIFKNVIKYHLRKKF
ncbi:MAG: FxsA family protein [Candidatus Cloacimonadota bacterium]|nr:FxsA family protein [Candidatus Cloacimonadota bacterium]